MTQIIAALTQDYVLVASDRQLTFITGSNRGQVADDNACKLVLLCGIWGIAYTGHARLGGVPTHEWIALRLAKENCCSPYVASQTLAREGTLALKASPSDLELTFLIAGWARSADGTLQPHFLLVTNVHERTGESLASPARELHVFERRLQSKELYAARVIGQPLGAGRGKYLHRSFRRMVEHKTSPKPAMAAFANEIAHSAERSIGVGYKVLAFSIPKSAAGRAYESGGGVMLAREPNALSTAFCYFDPAYSQLQQYGPAFVCGDAAVTDIETENDPSRSYQSASYRILHMPESGRLPALLVRATEGQ